MLVLDATLDPAQDLRAPLKPSFLEKRAIINELIEQRDYSNWEVSYDHTRNLSTAKLTTNRGIYTLTKLADSCSLLLTHEDRITDLHEILENKGIGKELLELIETVQSAGLKERELFNNLPTLCKEEVHFTPRKNQGWHLTFSGDAYLDYRCEDLGIQISCADPKNAPGEYSIKLQVIPSLIWRDQTTEIPWRDLTEEAKAIPQIDSAIKELLGRVEES